MKEIKYNLYRFDELTHDVQTRIVEKYHDEIIARAEKWIETSAKKCIYDLIDKIGVVDDGGLYLSLNTRLVRLTYELAPDNICIDRNGWFKDKLVDLFNGSVMLEPMYDKYKKMPCSSLGEICACVNSLLSDLTRDITNWLMCLHCDTDYTIDYIKQGYNARFCGQLLPKVNDICTDECFLSSGENIRECVVDGGKIAELCGNHRMNNK